MNGRNICGSAILPSATWLFAGAGYPPLQYIACREIGQLKKYIHMDIQDGQDNEKDRKRSFILYIHVYSTYLDLEDYFM
jgi:hypothetical protein